MAGRGEELEARRARRQKIFVAAGGVVLIALVGFQLPGLLSGGGSGSSPPATRAAVPLAKPVVAAPSSTQAKARSFQRLKARDLFIPQVRSGGPGGGTPAALHFPKAPAVRAKDFVVKNPFVVQVAAPAAASSTTVIPTPKATKTAPAADAGGSYIIVLGLIPGTGATSRKAAARAVVAAKNAGLKDVIANNALPHPKGVKAHFTVFTGPYTTLAGAQTELVRALRNGYPGARMQRVIGTPRGGF